ncbi:MAG: hypothetical protein GY928_28140 [Colwellia sp.]|nr:hypothetical protein [Colwellia sp.]
MTEVIKKKSNAGRPPSAGMSADSIKKKINHELTKAHRDAANNLPKYFEILQEYAMGKGSDTNTVSSCKMFIEMAQNYLQNGLEVEQGTQEPEATETPPEEVKQVSGGDTAPLSFADKKALWEKQKAEKAE